MLHEINSNFLQSTETQQGLRWFNDLRHDLFVWFDSSNGISRFQFCYDKQSEQEQAVEWVKDKGLIHQLVDDGEDSKIAKQSPIFVSNGTWNPIKAFEEFKSSSLELETSIRLFILDQLDSYIKNI